MVFSEPVPPACAWLKLKPTPTMELYAESAVTVPTAHNADVPNAGVQPVEPQVGAMHVEVFDLSPFQANP